MCHTYHHNLQHALKFKVGYEGKKSSSKRMKDFFSITFTISFKAHKVQISHYHCYYNEVHSESRTLKRFSAFFS